MMSEECRFLVPQLDCNFRARGEGGVLVATDFIVSPAGRGNNEGPGPRSGLLQRLRDSVLAYLDAAVPLPEFPLAAPASGFVGRFRSLLQTVPPGEVISYGDLGRRLNSSARAVGRACSRNPFALLVPCHRVIATGGDLGGYAYSPQLKCKLLRLEGVDID